jgi:hypothetical protein
MTAWKGIVGKAFTPVGFIAYVHDLQWVKWRPSFIVLHNTAIPTFADWHKVDGITRMRALERYYRDEQHWSGGPHLFIDDRVIWAFTPLTVPGVHAPSWNSMSIGVEMVGDYDHEPLSDSVRHNTASALATLHEALGLDPATLRFHKEDPLTTHRGCPGKAVVKEEMIALVQQKLYVRHDGGEHLPERVAANFDDVVGGSSTTAPAEGGVG